jgi:membrane-bound metal-dependent hydrolase YbcI (DUF457 family)
MPSPLGHLMAGAMIGLAGEFDSARGAETAPLARGDSALALVRRSITPLVVVCAGLAASPDLDMLVHAHRTWSHSLGAAGAVWAPAAVVAWRLRLPVLKVATICAAAYGSHVVLDWLAYPDFPTSGPMALWPFSHRHYSSGLDLFLELRPRTRWGLRGMVAANLHALAREMLVLLPPLLAIWLLRLRQLAGTRIPPARRRVPYHHSSLPLPSERALSPAPLSDLRGSRRGTGSALETQD